MGKSMEIVKGIYEALDRGDVRAVLGAFDPRIHWREAESSLYSDRNPYTGPLGVAEGVFQRLVSEVENFTVYPADYIEAGDTVVVEGRYVGKMKSTGTLVDAQFAHVWRLRGEKAVRFQQYTDTKQWAEAAERRLEVVGKKR